jgi:hypothetical protein
MPLMYTPSWDPSPVLTLPVPDHIKTLAGCPRDKTVVVNGINLALRERDYENCKETFYLTRGDTEYSFKLFYDDAAAARLYSREKQGLDEEAPPVFKEVTKNGLTAGVRYTEQPRECPSGLYRPMGYYVSRSTFILHNAHIRIKTRDSTPKSDNLNAAIRDLARMLSKALNGQ